MRSFFQKALLIALDSLGAVAVLITIGMIAIIVGSIGAILGYVYATLQGFSDPVRYGVVAAGALLAPVWLCVWLWRLSQQAIRPDDDPSQSS